MAKIDHPAFDEKRRAGMNKKLGWVSPNILGDVNEALKKYRKSHAPFIKQMERFIIGDYIDRLFRQAWLRGYSAGRKEGRDEADSGKGE